MSLVGELAAHAHAIAAAPVPQDVLAATRAHLTDAAAALVAGHLTLGERLSRGPAPTTGPSEDPRRVAFVGGVYAHCWEVGDIHRGAVLCPGCVVLPATLAVLGTRSVATPGFEAAYLAGYEVALAAATAIRGERLIGRGWWPTALVAPLGAAAAASILLGRSPEVTASAIALAAQHAGGAIAGDTAHADGKYLLSGFAAERAVTAVLAADAGWAGPLDILDDPRSPLRRSDADAGPPSGFLLPQTSLKPHAGAKHLQSAVDAVLDLRAMAGGWGHREIRRMTCRLPAQLAPIVDRPPPFDSTLNALGSAQFVLAVSALRGRCTPWDFEGGALHDEQLLDLAGVIEVEPADDLSAAYPARWGARVDIVTGTTSTAERLDARGDPDSPLTENEIVDKFATLAGPRFGEQRARAIAEAMLHPGPEGSSAELREHVLPLLRAPATNTLWDVDRAHARTGAAS